MRDSVGMEDEGGGRQHRAGVGGPAYASAAMRDDIELMTSRMGDDFAEIAKSWFVGEVETLLETLASVRVEAQSQLRATNDALERALAEVKVSRVDGVEFVFDQVVGLWLHCSTSSAVIQQFVNLVAAPNFFR